VRIHLVAEHPLELETAYVGLERLGFGLDVARGSLVVLAFRQLQQLGSVRDALGCAVDFLDSGSQARALAS
jgi:hypothetical protein